MKKIMAAVLIRVLGFYLLTLSVMTPLFNFQYANEHGFINWVLFGEVVSTLKSVVWPYYVFFSNHDSPDNSTDKRHYTNSKKACDEAIEIVINSGEVSRLSSEDRAKVADLLGLALDEANKVQLTYLQKAHRQLPKLYDKNYKYAIKVLIQGLQTNDTKMILAGTYGYNEFAIWMQAHAEEISF